MSDDWNAPVEDAVSTQQDRRDKRLLAMNALLRDRPAVLMTVALIKEHLLLEENDWDAIGLWQSLEQDEQIALWIAPTYGGLFTPDERKRLRPTTVTQEEES